MRLDQALLERGLLPSREKAQRAILAGLVRVNGQLAHKASDPVTASDELELEVAERYVSRGGIKLERALASFGLPPAGFSALDIGASTGGFTDCLIPHGAGRVYAVDVGHGQLAWKLRQDPRVVVMERTNARTLTRDAFPADFAPVELATLDCSFISLRKILDPVAALVRAGGRLLPLVKPQFEAGKAEADRGAGVITDPAIHERVLAELAAWVGERPELIWKGVVPSPITGPAGNIEFLASIEKRTT